MIATSPAELGFEHAVARIVPLVTHGNRLDFFFIDVDKLPD